MSPYTAVRLTFLCASWITLGTSNYEKAWRRHKDLPQYKFVARPLYKIIATQSNSILATAGSFFLTDLFLHQLGPCIVKCTADSIFLNSTSCKIYWDLESSLSWLALSLPVMYAKYKKL